METSKKCVDKDTPVIGQHAIVYPGTSSAFVGLVLEWSDTMPGCYIKVRHPVSGIECNYDPKNVKLLPLN